MLHVAAAVLAADAERQMLVQLHVRRAAPPLTAAAVLHHAVPSGLAWTLAAACCLA